MTNFKSVAMCFALLTTAPAAAGTPVNRPMTCPVGGETFEIITPSSCSTMGRTMSFRPMTTCDWQTHMPACPSNGLPIYRNFSPDDIVRLEQHLSSEKWAEDRKLRPMQRAYALAGDMGDTTAPSGFFMLLNAFWYETRTFFENEAQKQAFFVAAEEEIRVDRDGNGPFFQAILAFALAHDGQGTRAKTELAQAKAKTEADAELPEFLRQYIAAIEACLPEIGSPICRPEAPLVLK
ncbi:hypothetical protein SAMN04488036_101821 [Shimia haliotis]|uniref:DUF4034 domain-containing protein n=2 Tax=Shimia haliotis TaxID=1280847 RepID=A0A1I4B769_9RHOB|nr:hypothetical protein SAMN04488036_101821 [Shimia haliotis]